MTDLALYRDAFLADDLPGLFLAGDGVLAANPAAARFFKRPLDVLTGLNLSDLLPVRQPDEMPSLPLFQRQLAAATDRDLPVFTCHFLQGDGDVLPAQVQLLLLPGQEERTVRVRLLDPAAPHLLAGNAAAPAVLCEQQEKLDSLGRMAGGLAHDFNNFLLAILGNADLMDRDLAAGKTGTELLDEIRKAAGRAADLCNQLLAYAGRGQASFQNLDLTATIQEMVPMLKVAISRKIVLRLDLQGSLPLVEGDLTQLHQLIMNLVVNASEAVGNRQGTITLATGRGPMPEASQVLCALGSLPESAELVYCEVRDDGEGVPADTLHRIFDPYFSTKIRGRGMGLASVLGTVRGHQGMLCLLPNEGGGSVFRVYFPEVEGERPEVPLPETAGAALPGRGTILIVDDEEYLRVLCSRMLQRLGYQVLLAGDGPEALDIYQKNARRIDGVILDLVMPVMDGVEVLERLLALDPEARVIMTSGYHEHEIATRLAGRGIAAFIQKPYVLSDLGQALTALLRSSEGPDPAD